MWRRVLVGVFFLLFTSILIAQPAFAQNVVWHADYFNNGQLSGTPAFTRSDPSIAFNWGTGSPGSGVGSDNFSVRWATDAYLTPGTYRFYAQADDEIRVIFNFGYQPVIDTFGKGQAGQLVTGDVNVPAAGTYHIQVDYRELTDQAWAYVSFANLATNPSGPGFATPSSPINVPTGSWTAQYYGNATLSGDPVAILGEGSPSHHWGSAAPFTSLPADNFSVRWTSTQNLTGGSYYLSVAADDGVRVWVNGTLIIDQWHAASGQTYSASLNLPTGPNYFQVEYYESTGEAFIDFTLAQTGGAPAPTQQPAPTNSSATVTAYKLNVRATPDGVNGQILLQITRNQVYPILAKNADSSWYQLNINGTIGWVNGNYINISNPQSVPVTGSSQGAPSQPSQPALTGNTLTSPQYNVVMRSGPGTQYRRIGLLPVGGVAQIVGRTSNNSWWQINLNGLVGWVTSQYTQTSPSANFNAIPVTG